MNLNEHINKAERELTEMGYAVDQVLKLGNVLCRVEGENLDSSFAEFHNAAGRLPYAQDSDFGGLVLEKLGDTEAARERRQRLYREARWRAMWCAQNATSGGEGIARSQDIQRLTEKEKACTTTPLDRTS